MVSGRAFALVAAVDRAANLDPDSVLRARVGGMKQTRLVRVSVPLLTTLAALLFADAAPAETWTGETTTVAGTEGSPSPEITLVKASAAYDPLVGNLNFTVVTGAAPQPEIGGKPNEGLLIGMFVKTTATCGITVLQELSNPPGKVTVLSEALFEGVFSEPTVARGINAIPPAPLPVDKTVSGATTSFKTETTALKDQGFNCVIIRAEDAEQKNATVMAYPIAPPPPPPAPTPPTPAPAPPIPAPAALSIAKPKPQTLKVGRWKTVKVKVTNTGATASVLGSLRVKAPKGVLVKPEKQKLPTLDPGESWTVSIRLELTKKAKEKSTVTLTGSAPGATSTTGSFVLKLKPEDNATGDGKPGGSK